MKAKSQECATLREYREQVLRVSQLKAGRLCGKWQADIWRLEHGQLPRPWNRQPYLEGLKLDEAEFERLVMAHVKDRKQKVREAQEEALKKPISETDPLFASATAERKAKVELLPENHPEVEQVRRVAQ